MDVFFWLRRFVLMFCLAFAVILAAHFLGRYELKFSLSQSLLWGIITANIFIFTRHYRSGKARSGALCNDTPSIQNG